MLTEERSERLKNSSSKRNMHIAQFRLDKVTTRLPNDFAGATKVGAVGGFHENEDGFTYFFTPSVEAAAEVKQYCMQHGVKCNVYGDGSGRYLSAK